MSVANFASTAAVQSQTQMAAGAPADVAQLLSQLQSQLAQSQQQAQQQQAHGAVAAPGPATTTAFSAPAASSSSSMSTASTTLSNGETHTTTLVNGVPVGHHQQQGQFDGHGATAFGSDYAGWPSTGSSHHDTSSSFPAHDSASGYGTWNANSHDACWPTATGNTDAFHTSSTGNHGDVFTLGSGFGGDAFVASAGPAQATSTDHSAAFGGGGGGNWQSTSSQTTTGADGQSVTVTTVDGSHLPHEMTSVSFA
ncbi:hypothetical protein H9P43_006976 [Blastocladiella emersonii ATCC 22665]|nr:hypothetical protein H9P43_006972 [Blastocladiella emersonii ATCC 22665]KAI9175613.1 hypothetical protein H9P43_006976 [Blastocladiella emersonii ATCC 22665]